VISLKRFRYVVSLLVLVLSLASVASLHAQQTTGSIVGTVKDESGAVVNASTAKATNVDTGFSRSAPSNGYGEYRIDYLPVGKYTVELEAAGFRRFVQQNIVLNVDQTLTVDITLSVGAATETVTVTTAPPLVNTSDAYWAEPSRGPRSLACPWSIAMHTPKFPSRRA
jgi:hypothetical protein